MVRYAARRGWDQRVIVGVPASEPDPEVGGLLGAQVHPLIFGEDELNFPVPGMSDVMPYRSTRFSSMSKSQIATYKIAWRKHLRKVIKEFQPHVIHTHHIWIMSSLIREVAPHSKVINHCHATGLRQMKLCPELADDVRLGCAKNDHFAVLHTEHANQLMRELSVDASRIHVVGAGYCDELFNLDGRTKTPPDSLLYIGKYSSAKGLPWLLDAVQKLKNKFTRLRLHVAGTGSGSEAEMLSKRMRDMHPHVVMHGQVDQLTLAQMMRRAGTCVLPSFYEGVPLVLVEAFACGCRLVATDLLGVRTVLAKPFGDALKIVPLPRLQNVDVPEPDDLPQFVARLTAALEDSIEAVQLHITPDEMATRIQPFTWNTVFGRVESIWNQLTEI
jgi:glycosyltransferase involved in cell wall biosynthesis